MVKVLILLVLLVSHIDLLQGTNCFYDGRGILHCHPK